jgi:hypothetical protein
VAAESVDVVFCSTLFEHLPDTSQCLATLRDPHGPGPGGRLLALQPNIRLVGGAYWDFIDDHFALIGRTLVEVHQPGVRGSAAVSSHDPGRLAEDPVADARRLAFRPALTARDADLVRRAKPR